MVLKLDEITARIRDQIESFEAPLEVADVGSIISVGDGIARVSGLANVMATELLEFPGGVLGIALNLEERQVGAVILGDYEHIEEGDTVKSTERIASVPVGDALIGRVVNAVGEPVDGKGPVQNDDYYPVEKIAPGVIERANVDTPVQTGIKAIDSMIPIGRGQRELIIGDRQTGKTALAIDTIINQKGQDLGRVRGYGAHGGGRCGCVKSGSYAIPGALCRLRHGRIFHGPGARGLDHVRRS
jgi:F-type H+-transporting ATPase subunit alpha